MMSSLADDLEVADNPPPRESPTAVWIAEWYAGLDEADKATFDQRVADPRKSVRRLWEVLCGRGFPYARSAFNEWVNRQRESR